MRPLALIPIVLCAASLVLTFLCLFAGSTRGFMEGYDVLTLNTSRIGQNLFNTSETSSNPLIQFLDNITNTLGSDIENDIGSIARALGLHDFYSAHLMDYCEGYYTPGPVPNATLSKSDISKNVTSCSDRSTLWDFDPEQILQSELDQSGHSEINLINDFNWPEDIDKGLQALRKAWQAMFVLYCIAIGFIAVALISAVVGVIVEGRMSACLNVIIDWLAFLTLCAASGIATVIAVKGSDVVNHYGKIIGISANEGEKFLILTWLATGAMLLASIVWCFDCAVGRKRPRYGGEPKYG